VFAVKGIDQFPEFVRALPEVDLPFPGTRGWLLQAGSQQVVFLEFAETIEVPEHSHAEQLEFALAGRVELNMDGAVTEYGQGENFFIPAGKPHGATVHAGYRAMILFNAPDRYLARE
jgi:quercetin dioxygenase-like cupin family protein